LTRPHIETNNSIKKIARALTVCRSSQKHDESTSSAAAAAAFTQIDINNSFFFGFFHFAFHYLGGVQFISSIGARASKVPSSELLVLIRFGFSGFDHQQAAVEQLNGGIGFNLILIFCFQFS
jgi:hypothetical protein